MEDYEYLHLLDQLGGRVTAKAEARALFPASLEPDAAVARMKITIEVWGALAFLWDRVVAREQMQGIEDQTQAFVRFAEATAS